MDRVRVVAVESERDRLERRRGAGDRDQRAGVAIGRATSASSRTRSTALANRPTISGATADRSRRSVPSDGRFPSAWIACSALTRSRRRRTRWNRRRCRAPGTATARSTDRARGSPRGTTDPASRSPLITSSSLPAELADRRANSSRFAASRTALVAATADAVDVQCACTPAEASEHVDRAAKRLGIETPVRSTPWPSRVMTMSRASSVGSPPASAGGSTTSSRMELVPWSIAATRPAAHPRGRVPPVPRPTAPRGRPRRQVERVVRVQALHTARVPPTPPSSNAAGRSAARSSAYDRCASSNAWANARSAPLRAR